MKLNPATYVYPPRTNTSTPFTQSKFLQKYGYRAQYKFNDSNIIIHFNAGVITLWSRHKDLLKNYQLPTELDTQLHDIIVRLDLDPMGHHRFNGGLLHFKHVAKKNTIVIWDTLVADGEYLLGMSYHERFGRLQDITGEPYYYTSKDHNLQVGHQLTPDVFIPIWLDDWDQAWSDLIILNSQYSQPLLEGLCIKSGKHKLEPGYTEYNNQALMIKSRVQTKRHLC